MKKLINDFSQQLEEALEIGKAHEFVTKPSTYSNVVICGMGGSGIGASFVQNATIQEISIPITIVKGYFLPQHVNKNSLVIVSSYSGNTEETIHCFQEALKRNATICAISSNGKVKEMCDANNLDCILVPGGNPPRSTFAYSIVQLFVILEHFKLISADFIADIKQAKKRIVDEKEEIIKAAHELAKSLKDKIPVLYSSDHIESVAIRWRQQFNENGKKLAWTNVVPEMNHNEIVGWRGDYSNLAVVFLRNENDFAKIAKRMDLNKEVYKTCTPHVFEVWAKGNSFIEQAIYHIHFGDWVSFYLAELGGYDVVEVKVIDELKANLA